MAVKTITVTREAYDALAVRREPRESFSEIILRVTHRKPLLAFAGALSDKSGGRLERLVRESRRRHRAARENRMKRIVGELGHGSPR